MSDNSKIEWTDATANYVNGCSVLSPGCTNCYAMRLAGTRMKHHPSRAGLTRATKAGPVWTGEVRANEKVLREVLGWKRPRAIFWNAHGDLFHENVPDEWIDRQFAVMALTPQHRHMVLTKRPARMREYLTAPGRGDHVHARMMFMFALADTQWQWPLPNVWLGVSVEDQARADERIPELLACPAAMRFISAEPLLGPVDLMKWLEIAPQIGEHLGSLVPLDDEVGKDRFENSDHITLTRDFPDSDRLPTMSLDPLLAPSDVAAPSGAKPIHDFCGGAIDGQPGGVRPGGSPPPIKIPLAVEQPGGICENGDFLGDRDGLFEQNRSGSPRDALAGDLPLDAGPTRAQPSANRSDSLASGISLSDGDPPCGGVAHTQSPTTIDWAIVGGESGPNARPMQLEWAQSLVDQCRAAGVACFVKQLGKALHPKTYKDFSSFPANLRVRETPDAR